MRNGERKSRGAKLEREEMRDREREVEGERKSRGAK